MSDGFWPLYGVHPITDAIYRRYGYRTPLPQTAPELFDLLAELGYLVGEREHLHLENAQRHLVLKVLDRNGNEVGTAAVGVAVDVRLNVGHGDSSAVAAGGRTPAGSPTVEVAADSPGVETPPSGAVGVRIEGGVA